MLYLSLLLQYFSLFGFSKTGNFVVLPTKSAQVLAFSLMLISFILMGLCLGWQIGVPLWFGTITVFGILHNFWLAMQYPPYKASAILIIVISAFYIYLDK